jgi:hypothetical protein
LALVPLPRRGNLLFVQLGLHGRERLPLAAHAIDDRLSLASQIVYRRCPLCQSSDMCVPLAKQLLQ